MAPNAQCVINTTGVVFKHKSADFSLTPGSDHGVMSMLKSFRLNFAMMR